MMHWTHSVLLQIQGRKIFVFFGRELLPQGGGAGAPGRRRRLARGIFPADPALAPTPGQSHTGEVTSVLPGPTGQYLNISHFSLSEPKPAEEDGGTYELMQFQMKAGENNGGFKTF